MHVLDMEAPCDRRFASWRDAHEWLVDSPERSSGASFAASPQLHQFSLEKETYEKESTPTPIPRSLTSCTMT